MYRRKSFINPPRRASFLSPLHFSLLPPLAVGDYGFLVEILDDFMNERGKTLTGIRAALDAKDYMELQELAHSQKGSALNLRLPRLAKVRVGKGGRRGPFALILHVHYIHPFFFTVTVP